MDFAIQSLFILAIVFFFVGLVLLFMKNSKMKVFLILSAVFFISPVVLILFVGSVQEVNNVTTERRINEKINRVSVEKDKGLIMDGEDAILTSDVFLALTEDYYDEMFDYIIADNQGALNRMITTGKIMPVGEGTRVTLIDGGILKAKIEVIATGERGFVPPEFLTKK